MDAVRYRAPVSPPLPPPPLKHLEALSFQAWLDILTETGIEPSFRQVCARLDRPLDHAALIRSHLLAAADAGLVTYHEGKHAGVRLRVTHEEARETLTRCLPAPYLTYRETSDANVA